MSPPENDAAKCLPYWMLGCKRNEANSLKMTETFSLPQQLEEDCKYYLLLLLDLPFNYPAVNRK